MDFDPLYDTLRRACGGAGGDQLSAGEIGRGCGGVRKGVRRSARGCGECGAVPFA